MHDVNSNEFRVVNVTTMATQMIEVKHYESDGISKKSEEVKQMWTELHDIAKARQEVRCTFYRPEHNFLICAIT